MTRKYDIVLLTDPLPDKMYRASALGAYRIATELRNNGFSVLVINWLSDFWRKTFSEKYYDPHRNIFTLLNKIISDKTLFVGYSTTFMMNGFGIEKLSVPTSYYEYRNPHRNKFPGMWLDHNQFNEISDYVKKLNPNTRILCGGEGIGRILQNKFNYKIDFLVEGLADKAVVEIAEKFSKNINPQYVKINGYKVINYDKFGFTFDFHNSKTRFEKHDFIPDNDTLPIEFHRGCMFACRFCSFPLLGRNKNDTSYQKKSSNITDELIYNYENFKVKNYVVVDDTFNESTEKLLRYRQAIKDSKVDIKFACYLRHELLATYPEQYEILLDMGLESCFFGIETLNPESAKSIGKKCDKNYVSKILEDAKKIWKNQVLTTSSFIIGLPHDKEEDIADWLQYVFDRKDIFDSFFMNPMGFWKEIHTSEFERNKEKYGYKFLHGDNWVNNVGITRLRALDISNYWMSKAWNESRLKLHSYETVTLKNIGYTFNEIQSYTLDTLPYQDIIHKYELKFQEYENKLFNHINDLWWDHLDSNQEPTDYESAALTN